MLQVICPSGEAAGAGIACSEGAGAMAIFSSARYFMPTKPPATAPTTNPPTRSRIPFEPLMRDVSSHSFPTHHHCGRVLLLFLQRSFREHCREEHQSEPKLAHGTTTNKLNAQ
jgi:hypothetical protein